MFVPKAVTGGRRAARFPRAVAALLALLSSVSVLVVAGDKNPGEGLATTIMSHLYARFPSKRVSVASAGPGVRQFANEVVSKCIYQVQPGQLEAAAIAAIDSANVESSSVSSVVRAAMSGVLESIGHGAELLPPVENMKPDVAHASFYDTGTVRVIKIPTLNVHEALDDPARPMCSGLKKYFDFSNTSPFKIIAKKGHSFELALPAHMQVHPMFHADKLYKAAVNPLPG